MRSPGFPGCTGFTAFCKSWLVVLIFISFLILRFQNNVFTTLKQDFIYQ
jgi:hypothetical protein